MANGRANHPEPLEPRELNGIENEESDDALAPADVEIESVEHGPEDSEADPEAGHGAESETELESDTITLAGIAGQILQLQAQLHPEDEHGLFTSSSISAFINESPEPEEAEKEYAALEQTLNQLDSCLDDLEQKNDDLNVKLKALLASSRLEYDALLTGSVSTSPKGGADGSHHS